MAREHEANATGLERIHEVNDLAARVPKHISHSGSLQGLRNNSGAGGEITQGFAPSLVS
jgi:hypothetical protein